jgi:uncharacterized protein (AIM24 family)
MTFTATNSKVVTASVGPATPVLARRGAMLGYRGQVTFAPVHGQGAGMGGWARAAVAGESSPMMVATGSGEVLYGFRGLHTTVIDLDGTAPLTCEADRLLAHDANLQTSVQFLGQGGLRAAARGAMTGQGLFTTLVHGRGPVALLSHGGIFPLHVDGSTETGIDPQAYVGHTGHLTLDISAKVGWRDAVGRGSGEAFQLKATGQGTVYVQASEQKFT